MKKIYLITALLLAFVFVFTACEVTDNESNASVSQNESGDGQTSAPHKSEQQGSEPEVSDYEQSDESSAPTPEVSDYEQSDESQTPEVSTEEYVWYGIDEINDWFETYILGIADSDEDLRRDGKHRAYYFTIDGLLLEYIDGKAGSSIFADEYLKLFNGTTAINMPALCEYYGITKEEYVAHCNKFIEEFGKSKEGEIPIYLMFRLYAFRYDAIFSEEYWNHSDYLLNAYVIPEIDDHYTSLEDRNGYTKRYYIIDRRLIEYVGVDEFEDWLDAVSDTEQNIIEFIDHFGITREIYEDIYRKDCWQEATEHTVARWRFLPYNPDYLFGTPEEQEIYFTVHPLN